MQDIRTISAIDVHAHYGNYIRESMPLVNGFMTASPEQVIARARQAATRYTIVSPLLALLPRRGGRPVDGNIEAADVVARHDELRQWVVIDPTNEATFRQADEMLQSARCVGIKIHPEEHDYRISDHGEKLFEFAATRRAVVLTHSGDPNSMPMDFVPFANAFPEMKLIVAHLGNNGINRDPSQQVRAIQASKNGNVFADTSSAASVMSGLLEWAVREVGSSRILYGTDTPLYHAPTQRARIDHADISYADKKAILHENAEALLGLNAACDLSQPVR